MSHKKNPARALFYAVLCTLFFAGCSRRTDLVNGEREEFKNSNITQEEENINSDNGGQENVKSKEQEEENTNSDNSGQENVKSKEQEEEGTANDNISPQQMFIEDKDDEKVIMETGPMTVDIDWAEYFGWFNGAAVLYDASKQQCLVYNHDLAATRRSPCSTFKIISSLIALENGIIDPKHSTRKWSGETFWNENWNRDIDFYNAFQDSCVWYFRQVTDDIGRKKMQRELDRLEYGNCDISDWEGQLNTNNNNRALTGFWLESSLLISPEEQTEVMERIFGPDSVYSKKTRNALKQAMLVPRQDQGQVSIYGKTGMGMDQGIVVDAWFTGFAEHEDGNVYFCVYIGQTDERDVTSAAAKEIAIQIVSDYYL